MTTWKDKKTTWGVVASLLLAAWPAWAWLDDNVIMTQAEGDQIIQAMNEREIDRVHRMIEAKERLIVQTKYRNDLNEQAKEELFATYREEIRLLKLKEACLNEGRIHCN